MSENQMLQEVLQVFLQEFEELIEQIEGNIFELEAHPESDTLMDALFRGYHTVKGGAGMSAWSELSDYTHHIENLLSHVRHGQIEVSEELISILLESLDCLKGFLDEAKGDRALDKLLVSKNLQTVQAFVSGTPPTALHVQKEEIVSAESLKPKEATLASEALPKSTLQKQSFLIRLQFDADFFERDADPMTVLQDLQKLGDTIVIPHTTCIPLLEDIDLRKLYLWWNVKLVTSCASSEIEELLMFFIDEPHIIPSALPPPPPTWQILLENQESVPLAENAQSASAKKINIQKEESAERDRGRKRKQEEEVPIESQVTSSIRVDIAKLDKLQNLVGEAVINQARLTLFFEKLELQNETDIEDIAQLVDDNEQTIRGLQEQVMSVRMIPIGRTFNALRRMVRDFAAQSGKQIQFEISGEETEIDKTITEQISGPLKHLIRNAMDHGIETPEVRQAHGKSPQGLIAIDAFHEEGQILIEIKDDGAGIDAEKVLALAKDKGLVGEEEELSERDIFHLLFKAGFSTAESVTDISGRGVGMDVVLRDIEVLHGRVEIQSELGKGTTMRIKLPLTLAIIEGMLTTLGEQMFIIPIVSIVESLQPQENDLKTVKNRGEMIEIRGEYIPLLRLHQLFNLVPVHENPAEGLVIVVENAGRKHCILVDEIIEQQHVVIKSLEDNFYQLQGIAGATILGDGRVSYILDIPGLVTHHLQTEEHLLPVA